MSPINRRDQGIRDALAGEQPVKRIVTICGWCPDRIERTVAARAHGFDVSHGLCEACAARLNTDIDRLEAARV